MRRVMTELQTVPLQLAPGEQYAGVAVLVVKNGIPHERYYQGVRLALAVGTVICDTSGQEQALYRVLDGPHPGQLRCCTLSKWLRCFQRLSLETAPQPPTVEPVVEKPAGYKSEPWRSGG